MFVIIPRKYAWVAEAVRFLAQEEGRSKSNMLLRLVRLGLETYGIKDEETLRQFMERHG